jgi:hypothetical protein
MWDLYGLGRWGFFNFLQLDITGMRCPVGRCHVRFYGTWLGPLPDCQCNFRRYTPQCWPAAGSCIRLSQPETPVKQKDVIISGKDKLLYFGSFTNFANQNTLNLFTKGDAHPVWNIVINQLDITCTSTVHSNKWKQKRILISLYRNYRVLPYKNLSNFK